MLDLDVQFRIDAESRRVLVSQSHESFPHLLSLRLALASVAGAATINIAMHNGGTTVGGMTSRIIRRSTTPKCFTGILFEIFRVAGSSARFYTFGHLL